MLLATTVTAACTGATTTSPTTVAAPQQAGQPAAVSTTQVRWDVYGPLDLICQSGGVTYHDVPGTVLRIVATVTNADHHFVANPTGSRHSDFSDCSPLNETNSTFQQSGVSRTAGPESYGDNVPLSPNNGVTEFQWTFNDMPCGHNEIEVNVNGTFGVEVKRANSCEPVVVCTTLAPSVKIGELAKFTAKNGDGNYAWSSSDGTPLTGKGATFAASFSTAGQKSVTVTSATNAATCTVQVIQEHLTCSVVTSSLTKGADTLSATTLITSITASFTGDGSTAMLTVDGVPTDVTSGTSLPLNLARPEPGQPDKVVTVILIPKVGGSECERKTLTIKVPAKPLPKIVCSVGSPTVLVGELAKYSATGGNGTYNWTTNEGSPSTGQTATFSTTYSTLGDKTVTVTSDASSATCTVSVKVGCDNPILSLTSQSTFKFLAGMHNASAYKCVGGGFWFLPKFTDAAGNPAFVVWSYRITKWVVETDGNPASGSGYGPEFYAPIGNVPVGDDIEIEITIEDKKDVFGWLNGTCQNCSVPSYSRTALKVFGPVHVKTN